MKCIKDRWWGVFPVFIFVYIPFFLVTMYVYDWKPKFQKTFIITMFFINAFVWIIACSLLIVSIMGMGMMTIGLLAPIE